MNPYFAELNKVPPDDKALRDAIKRGKVKRAIQLIRRGANLNGQYPDDWNTPLHEAIQEGWNEPMIRQLMSLDPDYGLVSGDDLTAAELALQQGMRSIGKQLIEAELKGFRTAEEACYEMMKRNSVEAMEMLVDSLGLPNQELVDCLTKVWRRLEVMNVLVRPDVEAFVHLRVIRHDYGNSLRTEMVDSMEEERIGLMMKDIDSLLGNFDSGLCHDISDEFLTALRAILKQLFVVKDGIKWFPAAKLEFCIAIYLAIFDRGSDMDLFRLLVHKAMTVQFLKQFRGAYDKIVLEERMTETLLFELVKVVSTNRNRKCKHIINEWASSIGNKFKFKEQVMIRNFIVNNFNNDKIVSVHHYREVSPTEKNKLKTKSIEINQMFFSRRLKYKYRNLFRTYFKLKQTYSMDKVKKCLNVVEKIGLYEPLGSKMKASILAMQRAIQIIGETHKSTPLSPNISNALRSSLKSGAPGTVLARITKLRELFSHKFSWTKLSNYERLKWSDPKLVELYKSVQADVLKLRPMLVNVCESHRLQSRKAFLGSVLQLRTADEVHAFAYECKKSSLWDVQIEHDADDVNRLEEMLDCLEANCKERNLQEYCEVVAQVKSELALYNTNFDIMNMKIITNHFKASVENLIQSESLEFQRNITRWILNVLSPSMNAHEFGPITMLYRYAFHHLQPILLSNLIDKSLAESIMDSLQYFYSSTAIDSYCANLNKTGETDTSNLLQLSCLQLPIDEHQKRVLTELLEPYCRNVFSIDGKYSTVKKFCKDHQICYSKQLLKQLRAADVQCFQNTFEDLIEQLGEILSFSVEVTEAEFVSMSVYCEGNQSEIMAAEMILLDILGILCERGVLLDFRASMINQRPVVTGRNLRNYLAHDSLVYDAVCGNKNSNGTVLLNAYCLYRYLRVNIYDQQQTHRRVVDPKASLNLLQTVEYKHKYLLAIELGQFEEFDFSNVEPKLRTLENSTALEFIALKQPKECLRFLLGDSLRMKPLMDILRHKSPNQRHSINGFDLSIRKLIRFELLQSHLNEYFSTSLNRLQDLKGSQFSNESLLIAIVRRNERFALSIINNPKLYGISRKRNSFGTILTLSVAGKLFAVVFRICEVDPEILMQTNSFEQSALEVAVMMGSLEMVRLLLKFKPPFAHSALRDALQFGMKIIFHEMMHTSNTNLLEHKNLLNNLLTAAAEANNLDVLHRLLPLVDKKSSIHLALGRAILQRNCEAVCKILQHNSEVINEIENHPYSPLITAGLIDCAKMVNLLLKFGADFNLPVERPALHSVIAHAKQSILKIFLQKGTINDKLKATLFERCLEYSKPKMALMTYKASYPFKLSEKNIACIRQIIPKMYRINPAVSIQMNGHILGLLILNGMHEFVKHIFGEMYPRMSKHELARCLICAIKANDISMVQFLLDQGCDFNQADSTGLTPLALSVKLGNEVLIDILLCRGANPDLESVDYCPSMNIAWNHGGVSFEQFGAHRHVTYPLIIALHKKFNVIAMKLMQNGASTVINDCNGLTPLVIAIANGDCSLVKMLIDSGANVQHAKVYIHQKYHKNSILHTVAFNGHLDLYKLLIEGYGFDPMATGPSGNTTLHTAVMNKKSLIVEYLLESQSWSVVNHNGQTPITLSFEYLDENVFTLIQRKLNYSPDVHSWRSSTGSSLLHMAVALENISLVHTLINIFNFDLNCFDTAGFTPIHCAIRLGNLELINILLKSGATLLATQQNQSQIPFQLIMWITRKFNVLRLLMSNPISEDALKSNHSVFYSLLKCSILLENYASCKLLLGSKPFDPTVKDQDGNSALHLAVSVGSVRIAALLLSYGSIVDERNAKNETPLMTALDRDDGRMAHYLFGKGASTVPLVNYRFNSNPTKTLLHWFAEQGKLNALRVMIERKNFRCDVEDSDGWTIGHYAAANNQLHVIDYLLLIRFPFDSTDKCGRSCMVCAIECGHVEVAKKLSYMDASISLVQQYNEKKSLLKDAIKNRQQDVVKFLIKNCNIKK